MHSFKFHAIGPLYLFDQTYFERARALNFPLSLRKDEEGPSSIRPTLQLCPRQRWGNFWETGWRVYGLSWARRYHLELNWTSPPCLCCCLGVTNWIISLPACLSVLVFFVFYCYFLRENKVTWLIEKSQWSKETSYTVLMVSCLADRDIKVR